MKQDAGFGPALESGQEGGGACGLWRRQWVACDLSGASGVGPGLAGGVLDSNH